VDEPVMSKLKVIFGDTIRSFRRLMLEVMGTFFLALAVIGIMSVIDEYRSYSNAVDAGSLRLSLSILFAFVMLIFGLHTFWKARKIR
jgi:hypothetical protein